MTRSTARAVHIGQFRLTRLQVVNWGTFCGYKDFRIDDRGVLLTGPSGSGKSSLMDAHSLVLLPTYDQRFNASADLTARGSKRNTRTVADYVRGAWSETNDENERSQVRYLRGGEPIWSAVGATYDDGRGAITTAVVVKWFTGVENDGAGMSTANSLRHPLPGLARHHRSLDRRIHQHHLDCYLATSPANIPALLNFLGWLRDRHIVTGIELIRPKDSLPQRFQHQDEHAEQLRRCLTDASLPLEVRVVGALIRLYAIPVVRIVELTMDRFHRDDSYAYLDLEDNAVVVPPSLAALIDELIGKTPAADAFGPESPRTPACLFPGRSPSRPRSTGVLWRELNRYGLPTLAARNTAMITNITEVDAVVVADLNGVAPQTAHKWAQYAKTSWAVFLAAQQSSTTSSNSLNR